MTVDRFIMHVHMGMGLYHFFTGMVSMMRIVMIMGMCMRFLQMPMLVDMMFHGDQPDRHRHQDCRGKHEPFERFSQQWYGESSANERADRKQRGGSGRAQLAERYNEEQKRSPITEGPEYKGRCDIAPDH